MVKLSSFQRAVAIRVISAYRTISTDGVGVLARIPPRELQIIERREKYTGVGSTIARNNLMVKWQEKWDSSSKARWTHFLIPDIEVWINQCHGEVDYYVIQALSGHGCFNKYLHKFRRSETAVCLYCSEEDDAKHTLFICSRWVGQRRLFCTETGKVFNPTNVMESLMTKEMWDLGYKTIRQIIETKEREHRLNKAIRTISIPP